MAEVCLPWEPMRLAVLLLSSFVTFACDGHYPRDPEQTSERVQRSHRVRVGLTEHAPWVVRASSTDPAGAEVELVQRFARALGAKVEWHAGQQEALLAALARFEIDLVIGGLHESTRFSEHVGLSEPWHVERWGLGLPIEASIPSTLRGVTVDVTPGSLLVAKLRKAGARPHETPLSAPATSYLLAAPLAVLQQRQLNVIDAELDERALVIATPPGENRWLGQLTRFLTSDAPALERIAQAAWR
jgi:polar amino acid transport system substrate-binding protein